MHKITLVSLLFYILILPAYSQEVSNVEATLDKLNRQIIISYDLSYTQSKYDRFDVELYLSTDGGNKFEKEPLTYVTGNVGRGVTPDIIKRIQWRYLVEKPDFTGKNITFKVKARLDMDAYEQRLSKLKGAEGALYSALLPGLGDYKVRSGKNYWWIGALSYGLVGSGTYLYFTAKDNYKKYENATSIPEADIFLNDAQNQKTIAYALLGAGAAIWLTDITLVLLRGIKNKKELATVRALKNKTSLRLDYNPTLNLSQAVFKYRF